MTNEQRNFEITQLEFPNVFMLYDGKLQEMKAKKTTYTWNGCGSYNERTTLIAPDGTEIPDCYWECMFATIEDYEANKNVLQHDGATVSWPISGSNGSHWCNVLSFILRPYRIASADGFYWTFDNKQPIENELELTRFEYDYNSRKYTTRELPKCEIYGTREEALESNVYTVVDEYGNETERVGVNKLLQLDDTQKELAKRWGELLKEMKANNMRIICDMDGNFEVYNTKNVKEFYLDCDPREQYHERVNRASKCFELESGDIEMWSDDSSVYIQR